MFDVKVFIFSPIQENTIILYNQLKQCIIIDPGCYSEREWDTLKSFIKNNGLQPKYLLNTHCHLDHVFGEKRVAEEYQLTPYIHEKEKPVLEYAPTSGLMWNLPFINYNGPLHYLEEGQTIRLGDDELEVCCTPGHSPGSVTFYCRKQQFVIGGDVLFKGSIGRTDLPGGNFDVLISSIRNKLLVLPDETVVYPGHGDSTTIGFEKKHNPFLQ